MDSNVQNVEKKFFFGRLSAFPTNIFYGPFFWELFVLVEHLLWFKKSHKIASRTNNIQGTHINSNHGLRICRWKQGFS